MSLEPLPPARLRARVGRTSSRDEFSTVGRGAWADILEAVAASGARPFDLRDWLDFGCGSGRVARYAVDGGGLPVNLTGLDVDRDAIAWCRGHLSGRYQAIPADPPTSLPEASADVVYSISVFAHLSEVRQVAWLEEIRRLLRGGGLLVASTHSPDLAWTRPDLTSEQHDVLRRTGYLFARSGRGFNDDSAFHSADYLHRVWGALFEPATFRTYGLGGYQDLHVWRKT